MGKRALFREVAKVTLEEMKRSSDQVEKSVKRTSFTLHKSAAYEKVARRQRMLDGSQSCFQVGTSHFGGIENVWLKRYCSQMRPKLNCF